MEKLPDTQGGEHYRRRRRWLGTKLMGQDPRRVVEAGEKMRDGSTMGTWAPGSFFAWKLKCVRACVRALICVSFHEYVAKYSWLESTTL